MSFHFLLYLIKKWKFLEMKTKNLTTKTEIMFIGLTTSRETISIEITDSMKYMKKPIIFPILTFKVFVLCIFEYGHYANYTFIFFNKAKYFLIVECSSFYNDAQHFLSSLE